MFLEEDFMQDSNLEQSIPMADLGPLRVLFSGRFDPPHPGHVISILRLHAKYGHVVVPVLDYKGRAWPASYCKQVFDECFAHLKGDIEVLINRTHFGEMTCDELKTYKCGLYASGNMSVIKHIEGLGMPCLYVDRAFNYEAHLYPKPKHS